jgi:hypothetical protein
MKKTIILIIFIGQSLTVLTQCVNGTSTNPSNPINNQIGATNPELLNSFLWVDPLAVANQSLNIYSLYNMNTPNNTPVTHIFNPFHLANQSYSYLTQGDLNKLDYHWEDGWELLSLNFGHNPDGSIITPVNPSIPYLIFYNRYRGILRVFFNSLTGLGSSTYDGVTIKLAFADNQVSGTFMPSQTVLQGLDKETNVTEIQSYSDHPNNSNLWCHADFQVGYDPCVCIFRSDISVKFKFQTKTDLEMTQRGITVEQDLINADGTVNDNKDFLTNVSADKSGLLVYKSIDKMVSKYQTELENAKRQNAAAKEHNQKLKFWKKALSLAKDGIPHTDQIISGLGSWGEGLISSITNGDTLVSAAAINNGVKEGLASGLDWLGGEFLSEQPYATYPTMPTAMFTESKYKGTITTNINSVAGTFYNPGSYTGVAGHWSHNNVVDAHTYPYYNETMGVFALLETPQIDLKSHIERNDNTTALPNQNTLFITKKALKLNKALNYQFNPALAIKEYDIQAMWVVKVKRGPIASQRFCCPYYVPHEGVHFETVLNKTKLRQVNMTSLDLNEQGGSSFVLNTLGEPIDLTFNSAMVPLDKLYDFQPELHFSDAVSGAPFQVEVQLKLIIEVTYNNVGSDGELTRQLFVQTYAVDDEDISATNNSPSYNQHTVPAYNLNSLAKNLTFSNPVFNGQSVAGCKLENGTYTCIAKNKISITGQINSSYGYNVEFIAGNKIEVDPTTTTTLGTTIQFKLGSIMSSTPMLPASQAAVTNFCKGLGDQLYRANRAVVRSAAIIAEEDDPITTELKVSLAIYPNPISNKNQEIHVNYKTNINAATQVYITDIHGRKVITIQSKKEVEPGTHTNLVNISSLTSGIYMCTMIVNDQLKTEKIVVLK